ncbi:hypothetical protein EDB19DRAFT_2042494 [Suillus lakei]|nr:hypothetical protein EDB19DRAFT_2042494 [Suillus lakei]
MKPDLSFVFATISLLQTTAASAAVLDSRAFSCVSVPDLVSTTTWLSTSALSLSRNRSSRILLPKAPLMSQASRSAPRTSSHVRPSMHVYCSHLAWQDGVLRF